MQTSNEHLPDDHPHRIQDGQAVDVDVDKEDVDEKEFSFVWEGAPASPIAAEDAFMDGQIKPSYPLFNIDLLVGNRTHSQLLLPIEPQAEKVFVEIKSNDTSAPSGNDDIMGPYCEWSKKAAVELSPPPLAAAGSKKCNSTGFSKLWRFKEFGNRSNSDGRDAFVFLNHHATTNNTTSSKANEDEKVNDGRVKVMKKGKGKTTTLSAHEIYMRSKAKEGDRHRSYLPYKPEVFGFFTNVNGGLTKNVHPF